MNTLQTLVEVRNVWKIYGQGSNFVHALRGVSLDIAAGEIISIMGPSGCGKTSLLNCMSGIDDITQGKVLVEGIDQSSRKMKERDAYRVNRMGFVFQSYNLIPVLTAAENVELPLLCKGTNPKEARKKAMEVLSRVGLLERAGHRPAELSGGQQQRVAIARAIVNDPVIVWADEPTGALDRTTNMMVMDLIDHLNRTDGITFVIVTHNPEVADYAHRTFYMDSGKIVDERRTISRKVNEPTEGSREG